ncbi:UNVERIFIED_CONTAM: Box C/D snoRNA protein 1 [Gekko kuhli]
MDEAKYRCPRCMKYSCSLVCVKQHKTTYNCNGVREKTAFVSINQFSDLNLLSDYRFLEDVGRMADRAARDGASHRPRTNKFLVSFVTSPEQLFSTVSFILFSLSNP